MACSHAECLPVVGMDSSINNIRDVFQLNHIQMFLGELIFFDKLLYKRKGRHIFNIDFFKQNKKLNFIFLFFT